MTVDEKIGQLRLISVGPDNPKEAIREMIKNGQVGAIFNTVTRPDIRVMQDQVMQLSRLKIRCSLPTMCCTVSAPCFR
ncbi:beta-D-glucoside glucohydrolase [Klebsiella pneumoniae]|uniref:Beta-D-glucoside glucohydrolase n=1 Tax=Klebsiella pneumoniae TaxID=573 RepID=A0A378G350_KLEPN|nr:beta-D-glucoside glucohydrolase [Klebsiella pneumoniae]